MDKYLQNLINNNIQTIFICIIILSIPINNAFAQNELYLNQTDYFYNNGSLVFINGEINNNDAQFVNKSISSNNGIIELTGNWTNNVSINSFLSNGIERFSGNNNQLIIGAWNGVSGNSNQFYNLKINKSNGYVSLAQNTHVNDSGSVQFESTGGIIRTATSSSNNTGDYAYYLYIQNPSSNSLSGYNFPSGTTKYIEGKLKRQVNSTDVYDFPIGFQPSDKDGMEAYQVTFNNTPISTGIVGYIRPATKNVLYKNILCDIGTDPGIGSQTFPLCSGPKDGIYDLYYLDQNLSHEWMAIPDSNATYNYNITFFPGNNLDNLPYFNIPSACDGLYNGKRVRVIANDGVVGGSEQVGASTYAPFSHLTSYIWCDFDNNTLSNQTSFSSYRYFGTSFSSYTALPVELINFSLVPKYNQYFQLVWSTASELNNAGFEVERSEDAYTFTKTAWVQGNGTTASYHNYQIDDKDVVANKDYYYRLKQIDNNGKYLYSNVISGKLLLDETTFNILNIHPNPATNDCWLNISTPDATTIEISLINVLGQQTSIANYDIQTGQNKIKLDISSLPSGTYLVQSKYKEQFFTKKLIKN